MPARAASFGKPPALFLRRPDRSPAPASRLRESSARAPRAVCEAIDAPGGRTHKERPCGRNSVVECQLPKLDVAGSIPVARSDGKPRCSRGFLRSTYRRIELSAAMSPLGRSRRRLADVPHRVHPLVEHAHDFDHLRLRRAVEDDVYGHPNAVTTARMPYMEAAESRKQLVPGRGGWRGRALGDRAERGGEQRCIPCSAFCTPAVEARREDVSKIRLRGRGEAKSRHSLSEGASSANAQATPGTAAARRRRAR